MAGPKSKVVRYDLPIQGPQLEWVHSVVLNRIDGFEAWRKFGYVEGVGTSFETVWSPGGIHPIITTTETLSVVSSSTADDTGGTGAITVTIQGLDSAGAQITETLTLNGQTPVISVNSYRFVNRCFIVTSGNGLINAGAITFTNTSSAQLMANIAALDGITHQVVYKVPAANHLILEHLTAGTSKGDDLELEIKTRTDGGPWHVIFNMTLFELKVNLLLGHGIILAPLSEVLVEVKKISGGGILRSSVELSGYLVNNVYFNTP